MSLLRVYNTRTRHQASFVLSKRWVTFGKDASCDIVLPDFKDSGVIFSILIEESGCEITPGKNPILINQKPTKKRTPLQPMDRIESGDYILIYDPSTKTETAAATSPSGASSMGILNNLSSQLQLNHNTHDSAQSLLKELISFSGAESGFLLSAAEDQSQWTIAASTQQTDRSIYSQSILNQAVVKRQTIFIESIVGNQHAQAESIVVGRIFSTACVPLILGQEIVGALILQTHTPGRSIRKESLGEIEILATQAALLLRLATRLEEVKKENLTLLDHLSKERSIFVMAADSPMQDVVKKITQIAPTDLSALIQGESGTGKELAAREIHRLSQRASGPFVAVNCAAIPSTLLESTLFGHERGAFTGANKSLKGKFKQAQGGTLFLDEIGDLPLELQAKLLRVLQEKQIEPLGSTESRKVDFRLICATHKNLKEMVQSKTFRQDLFYRVHGVGIELVSLRKRKNDIAVLTQAFIRKSHTDKTLSHEAMIALQNHSWPGNVRELEQTIQRAVVLSIGAQIQANELDLDSSFETAPASITDTSSSLALEEAQEAFTQQYVESVLRKNAGRRAETAKQLGISERTLYRILSESET